MGRPDKRRIVVVLGLLTVGLVLLWEWLPTRLDEDYPFGDRACRFRGFRITFSAVDVHRSAREHGVADEDALHAAGRFLVTYPLSDEGQGGPRRELRLGPDRAGNLLEVVVLLLDDGDELVIHAMRMRPRYRGLLP